MSHFYDNAGNLVPEGTGYPSPTTILAIRHNQGLQDWRDRVGAEEADRRGEEAMARGTRVHAAVEEELRWGEGVVYDAEIAQHMTGFHNWREKYQPETIQIEAFVVSERYAFAGRVDYICRIDGELYIVDWKTSKGDSAQWRHKAKAYLLQLAAYRQAYYEMTGEWAKIMVVQLTEDIKKGYRTYEPGKDDPSLTILFDIFQLHRAIFDWAVRIGEITFEKPQQEVGLITV